MNLMMILCKMDLKKEYVEAVSVHVAGESIVSRLAPCPDHALAQLSHLVQDNSI